jgi:hypothetical protein
MSRSFQKRPFTTWVCCQTQKEAKRQGNRRLRRRCAALIVHAEVDPEIVFPIMDEVMDVWSMPKDGTDHYAPYRPGDWWYGSYFEWYKAVLMK